MKIHVSLIRCLGVFLTISSLLRAEPVKLSDYKTPVRVACVGDSITQGSGAAKGMSYPSQLQELLGDGWKVGNFGVGGRTLMRSGDLPYWNEAAFKQAQEFNPDVVVIMLGTNDTKPQNWSHKDGFEKDYRDLVKTFQDLKSKPRIFLCRAVPVPGAGNYGINEAGIQEQIPIVDRLAQELKTGTIDMHAALADKAALLPDRVHPNTEGAGEMAKAAFQVITGIDPSKLVRPNGLFHSGAVLQRGVVVPVWGTAGDGTKIAVQFAGQVVTTTASGGKWLVKLKPMPASSEPRVMKIVGSTTITLENILVGDVWLASGQSNMERQLGPRQGQKELVGWRESAAAANFPLIREFKLPLKFSATPEQDTSARWAVCNPENAPNFSAVGFYFARDLQPKIRVPVGIIHSSWGGTVIEAWTSPEVLKQEGVDVGEARNQNSPAVLYQAMIAPLLPFPIKGVLWYQGESNNGNAREYRDRFPAMIADWRKRWNAPKLPFLFVQIAPHKDMSPELREAQFLTLAKSENTAMAVITDIGDANDIHPANKEPVGVRLSLAARALAYGEKIEWSGPLYKSMKISGDRVGLTFTHAGKDLEAKGGDLKGFTIAGADGKFVPAAAEIHGTSVIVSSKEVPVPKAVRYGWENVPDVNLFNQDGLPASPFRTDVN
ncbi:MAG: GDSL-type esterase/lipase family protein [Luteolibacter sp.]